MSSGEQNLMDALLILGAIVLLVAFELFNLGEPLMALLSIKSNLRGDATEKAILKYVNSNLKRLDDIVSGINQKGGRDLDSEAVRAITELCFTSAPTAYDGTDSNVPSSFKKLYPTYLSFHAQSLKQNGTVDEKGTRILTVDKSDLRVDSQANPDDYYEFLQWHQANGVKLLQADPGIAKEFARRHGLNTTDVGIWHGHYALLFTPSESSEKVRMAMVSPLGDESTYDQTVKFFHELKDHVKEHTIQEIPELLGGDLSNNWEDFVDCDLRLRTEGPFLLQILDSLRNQNGRVLDAAAGIGCESVYLQQHEFDVTYNEIEPRLKAIATQRAHQVGEVLNTTSLDWRRLDQHWKRPCFSAVLVLGNSLCLVLDEDERKKCIVQFFKVLKPGGILVIDERNFPYILREKVNIERRPVEAFRYTRSVMYCGTVVQGVPEKISEEKVRFVYFRKSDARNLDEAQRHQVGTLDMYPFKAKELQQMLEDAGFQQVRVFSDFKEGYHDQADFFTYVARKPYLGPRES